MKLNAPTTIVWWISLLLGAFGLLMYLKVFTIAVLKPYDVWFIVAGLVLMLLATLFRRM